MNFSFHIPVKFNRRMVVFVVAGLICCSTGAQSLLWKITRNDLQSRSYIYGTIHIRDKRVFQFDKKVYEALEGCRVFALEVDLSPENISGFARHMMLPDGKSLKEIFKPGEYQLISSIIENETGMDMMLFDRMKPFALLSVAMNSQISSDMEVTIDEFFYRHSVNSGKRIIGLETVEEQMEMLEKIPLSYIVDYFRNFHQSAGDLEEIITLYCRADLDRLLSLMQQDKAMATLEKQLIIRRNKKMTERILPLMDEESVFIAVGAGHLPGKKGILRLLEKEGYLLTPVEVNTFDCD